MSDINIVLENRDDIHVAVEEKDINVEVPAGKDGRSLRPRGEWSASAAYAYLDLVSYDGSSYVALKAVPAGTLPTETSYWMLSAEKGEPGTPEWGEIAGNIADQTDLQTALDAKADVIISSASGSIASFSDGSPAPVTALSVSIEPVQAGTGDPSPTNVRPISGHTSATVTRTGKNLLSNIRANTYTSRGVTFTKNADNSVTINGTVTGSGNLFYNLDYSGTVGSAVDDIRKLRGKTVTYSVSETSISGLYIYFGYFKENGSNGNIHGPNHTYDTVVIPQDAYKARSYLQISGGASFDNVTVYPQLELGSFFTGYESYQKQSVSIDLDGTRYGGTLNVLTGEMTVTHKKHVVTESDGTIAWQTGAHNNGNRVGIVDNTLRKPTTSEQLDVICNMAVASSKCTGYGSWSVGQCMMFNFNSNATFFFIVPNEYTTASDARKYLADNGCEYVAPLATPLTVQLTPSQLSTILGRNNIWADTGDTSVTYRADTKLFVQGQIAETAKVTRQMIADSATADGKAPKSLATGDLIIVGDELRKATANIGNGSAITASNSTIATLADVIKALQ